MSESGELTENDENDLPCKPIVKNESVYKSSKDFSRII